MIKEMKAGLGFVNQNCELMTKSGNFTGYLFMQFFGRLTNVLGPKIRSYFILGSTIRYMSQSASLEVIMKLCIKTQL